MNDQPTIFIVLGATGDLMKKKIAPALFNLQQQDNLPIQTKIIGFARRPLGVDGWRGFVAEIINDQAKKFLSLLAYQAGNFSDQASFFELKKKINQLEAGWKINANKLFYLAVPPESYEGIFKNIEGVDLHRSGDDNAGWTRLLIEKPFGRDEISAQTLNDRLSKIFNESQIYRLDHYLAKTGVLALRPINQPTKVKTVAIRLLETIGVEGRGPFYETVGALRDVGQNHLLSIFTILTGRPADQLTVINTARAQYSGYRQIVGVDPNSAVETYFKVTARLGANPWSGINFIFEGGKKMSAVRKEVEIEFHDGSRKIFSLASDQRRQYVAEYEKLLLAAISGRRELFLSREEVEAAWRFIDPIIKTWRQGIVPLKTY